jgi:hypothetical protein
MARMLQVPNILAMIVCDGVWRDSSTGKNYVMGVFSSIRSATIPIRHPSMTIYLCLTDGMGKIPLEVRLASGEFDECVVSARGEVDFSNPRMVVELALPINNVTFAAPGEYRWQLYAGDELLMERRMLVAGPKAVDEGPQTP